MNTLMLEQTAAHLTRQVRHWDRRLRLVRSVLWVPRGVILGLLVGVVIAAIARMRPWLLPEQVALLAVGAALVGGLGALAAIWLWPDSTPHSARYFDRRFDLKERVSTALELTYGAIPSSEQLTERQLADAVGAVRRVDVSGWLPVRARYIEIAILVLLAGLLAFMLLSDNPQTSELLARRDLQQTIDSQIDELKDTIEQIEENPSLTEAEKEALTQPLDDALNILEQPDVSQQEAVAALAEAGQSLQQLSGGMLSDQAKAYQDAARQLAGSDLTSDLAEGLKRPDLGQTADAMSDLSSQVAQDNLTQSERESLADQLEKAADTLAENNPALAEKLREAAQALREGDIQAAQKALQEASEALREQDQQLQNSPLAESADSARRQVSQSQQDLSQAGQDQTANSPANEMQSGQTGQSQSSQMQQGQQASGGQQSQGQQQPGSSPSQGQGQPGGAQDDQQAQQSGGGQSAEQQSGTGQGSGQVSEQNANQGQTEDGAVGQGQADSAQTGAITNGEAQGGVNAPSAGQGEGGVGSDNTAGIEAGPGEIPSNNSPGDSEGAPQEYTAENAPSTIGGQSEQPLDVGGQPSGQEGLPVQEGDFGPNPSGQSSLSYTDVYGDYRNAVSDALDSGRIPLDQRDVIHDYFSSLEP